MPSNSRLFFTVLSVGAALGLGSIFIYPYFNSVFSAIFFVPYIIALIIIGIPLLMLEFSCGQYFGKNAVDLFASIKKWLSGIGWLMAINAFILMSMYAVVLAWHMIYFFASFGLQWKSSPKTYFFSNVVQASNGFENFSQLSLPVFIAMIVAWIVIFFCIKKGHESIKRSFAFLMPLSFALMLFFLFYSLNLDNALAGIYYFFEADFSGLLDWRLWLEAFSFAILFLGVSFGVMNVFAKKSGNGFIMANSLIVVLFKVILNVAFAFILLAIFGFLQGKQLISDFSAFNNYSDLFIALSQALPFFYKPVLFSILFFVLLGIFLMLGISALAYSISHILVHKFNARHSHAAILVCGFGFLFGLLFAIKPGFYIMDTIFHFIRYNMLIALLLESLAIGWFFDSVKISAYINQYSKLKLGMVWRFFIRFIVPVILLIMIILQLKIDLLSRFNNYPIWALAVFGLGAVVAPLVVAFSMPQKILDRR